MRPTTPLPRWVQLAEGELRRTFGIDLWTIGSNRRTRLLTAALDAEPDGEQAVKMAVYHLWRRFRRNQAKREKQRSEE